MTALVDLHFMDPTQRRTKYSCAKCPVSLKKQRKCEDPGFSNLKNPVAPDDHSLKYSFCVAKATWFPRAARLYDQCRVACETGIMPKGTSLDEQEYLFTDVFPAFVERWKTRTYYRTWNDVFDFAPEVLKAIANMIKKMFGNR